MKTLEYVKTHIKEVEQDSFLDNRFTNGHKMFKAVDEYYHFGLVNELTFDEEFFQEQ